MQRPVSEIQPLVQPKSHELVAALAITAYRENPTADQLGEALAAYVVTMPQVVREAFDRHFARFESSTPDVTAEPPPEVKMGLRAALQHLPLVSGVGSRGMTLIVYCDSASLTKEIPSMFEGYAVETLVVAR